ncbi:MAG: hypothetical protein IPJ07_06235 [Acidobacteria bacterium]|nr:hypothetical protein [Acidobacteriota bacterium]
MGASTTARHPRSGEQDARLPDAKSAHAVYIRTIWTACCLWRRPDVGKTGKRIIEEVAWRIVATFTGAEKDAAVF